ncbi:MAG: hypothetical protein Kow0063_26400 [Anaerolineae bacterium]
MVADQKHNGTNDEPIEDGLSALRRLADLDAARRDVKHHDESPETSGVVETIPDWLELLLVKYGEEPSSLIGVKLDLPGAAQPIDLTAPSPEDRKASEVASLLEQMAAEVEVEPPAERLATSVDWGRPTRYEEDEAAEERTMERPDQIPQAPIPPAPAREGKAPQQADELDLPGLEAEMPPEPAGAPGPLEEEVPDWLHEIPSMPEVAPTESPGVAPPPEDEVPDWLEDLSGYAPDIESQPEADMHPEPEWQVPDWMKELDVTMPEEAGETPDISESEVPDWLKDLGAAAEQPPSKQEGRPPVEITEAEESEGELPDWLARLADMPASEAEAAPPVEPPPPTPSPPTLADAHAQAEEDVPDWLRELEAGPEEMPDWLRDLEAAGETPAAQPPPPEAKPPARLERAKATSVEPEEVTGRPDELKEEGKAIEQPVPGAVAGAIAPEEAEVPDWLASLREETPSPLEAVTADETSVPEYPPAEPVEEPEWLAALRATSKADVLELDEEVAEAEEELPDWLAELRASQAAAEAAPAGLETPAKPVEAEETVEAEQYVPPPEVEVAVPEPEEAQPPLIEMAPPAAEKVEVLDWLAEIEAAAETTEYTAEEMPPGEAELPVLEEEVPDWLRQMPPADLTPEAQVPEAEKETVETRRPPEWLIAELVPEPGEEEMFEAPSSTEEAVAAAEEAPLFEEAVPATEEMPPAEEAPLFEAAVPAAEETLPAEIPTWLLALKPEEAEPTEAGEEEEVLAGIPGLLPLAEEEPEGEEEPISALRSRIGVPTVPDVAGAELFKEVVSGRLEEPREAGPVTEGRRRGIVEALVWALVFIILIAGIALALLAVLDRVGDLLGNSAFPDFFGSPLVIDPAPVNTFRAQVTRLPPDSVVVVAFDYSPATEAEMEPLAQIIVQDLLDNQARVIGVSLRPEGALMAQRLFERFEDEYPYTERTINLGFLPGQTAGVRSLAFLGTTPLFQDWAHTLHDYLAWQDVSGLEDVALVVAVADSPLTIRWWVEQIGPGTWADRPMIAAVSAAADPSVRPYYNQIDPGSGQLLGLLSGVTDAAAYENRLGQPGPAVRGLAAQSIAHLGLIVIGLGGTVAGFRIQATREV